MSNSLEVRTETKPGLDGGSNEPPIITTTEFDFSSRPPKPPILITSNNRGWGRYLPTALAILGAATGITGTYFFGDKSHGPGPEAFQYFMDTSICSFSGYVLGDLIELVRKEKMNVPRRLWGIAKDFKRLF